MGVENDNIAPKSSKNGYQAKASRQGPSKERNRVSHANQRLDSHGTGLKNLSSNLSDEKEDAAPRSIRRDINVDELRALQNSINSMNVVTNYTAKYLIALECAGKRYIPSFGEDKFSLYNCDQSIRPPPAKLNTDEIRQNRNQSQDIYQNIKTNPLEDFRRAIRRISDESQSSGEADSKASHPLNLKSAFVKAISSRRMSVIDTSIQKNSGKESQRRRFTAPHSTLVESSSNSTNTNNSTQDMKSRPPRPRRGFFKRDTDSESVGEGSIRGFFSSSLRSLKEEEESDDESIASIASLTLKPMEKQPLNASQRDFLKKAEESYVGFTDKDSKINDYFYEN